MPSSSFPGGKAAESGTGRWRKLRPTDPSTLPGSQASSRQSTTAVIPTWTSRRHSFGQMWPPTASDGVSQVKSSTLFFSLPGLDAHANPEDGYQHRRHYSTNCLDIKDSLKQENSCLVRTPSRHPVQWNA